MVNIIDVHKKYMMGKNELWALQGVSLQINNGEFVALAGASGSGKTTLLNLIGCLDVPTQGKILFSNQDTASLDDNSLSLLRGSSIGFIFQTFNLLPVLTALENVEYPLIRFKKNTDERKELALLALEKVGLRKHADHRPDQLSGGQRQRVAIARALIHSPKLIVADEPTANLDKKTSHEILQLLKDLNEKNGQAVVITSHDSSFLSTCSKVIELSDGMVVK